MAEPIAGLHDPDLGMCDSCGTEEGTRRRTITKGCMAWLCSTCRGGALAEAANAEGPFLG